jgi:hypothetical protein
MLPVRLQELQAAGSRIPNDFSVVEFDNIVVADIFPEADHQTCMGLCPSQTGRDPHLAALAGLKGADHVGWS